MEAREFIKSIYKNKVAQNAWWLIGGKIAQMFIKFFVGLLTARYLGPSNYGLIGYASAYTGFFICFCTLGINNVIVKELIDYPGQEGKILGTSMVLRAISSTLSVFVIVMIACVADAGEPLTVLVVALSSIGVVFNVLDIFSYWFQSRYQSKVSAISELIAFGLTSAYRVYLIVTSKSVVYFALATSIDYILIGLILIAAYRKEGGACLSFSWTYGKSLLKISTPFILPGLMVAIYAQTDKLMLKHMIGEAEIGYYSTAVSISSVWCFVLSAIIQSMYPAIMESYGRSEDEFNHKNRMLYAIVFYSCVFVSVFFFAFASPIIRLLFGPAYIPAVGPLRIVTWYTAFSYLGVAREAWIVRKSRQKYLKLVYAGAALANVALNVLFIPLWGASGAALASLAAQIITTMVIPFFIPALRENTMLMLEAIQLKGIMNK